MNTDARVETNGEKPARLDAGSTDLIGAEMPPKEVDSADDSDLQSFELPPDANSNAMAACCPRMGKLPPLFATAGALLLGGLIGAACMRWKERP
ncbi:MAG: hypothetical protein WCZ66_05875 [Sphingomonadaceae bacterium]